MRRRRGHLYKNSLAALRKSLFTRTDLNEVRNVLTTDEESAHLTSGASGQYSLAYRRGIGQARANAHQMQQASSRLRYAASAQAVVFLQSVSYLAQTSDVFSWRPFVDTRNRCSLCRRTMSRQRALRSVRRELIQQKSSPNCVLHLTRHCKSIEMVSSLSCSSSTLSQTIAIIWMPTTMSARKRDSSNCRHCVWRR